jgi:hypothetical protein
MQTPQTEDKIYYVYPLVALANCINTYLNLLDDRE